MKQYLNFSSNVFRGNTPLFIYLRIYNYFFLIQVMAFYKDKDTMVDLKSQYNTDLRFVDKIGKSLASKFPQVANCTYFNYLKTIILTF